MFIILTSWKCNDASVSNKKRSDCLFQADSIYIYSLKTITYNFKVYIYDFKVVNSNLKVITYSFKVIICNLKLNAYNIKLMGFYIGTSHGETVLHKTCRNLKSCMRQYYETNSYNQLISLINHFKIVSYHIKIISDHSKTIKHDHFKTVNNHFKIINNHFKIINIYIKLI